MSRIEEIYSSLCLFTVTREVLKTPVISAFMAYCEEENKREKLKKYGEFVSRVYENGGVLSECIKKALFENENVYVKAISKDEKISAKIEHSLNFELEALSALASLTSDSFGLDMKVTGKIPEYDTEKLDVKKDDKPVDVEAIVQKHAIAKSTITGLFEEVKKQATTDPLTDLFNRRFFTDRQQPHKLPLSHRQFCLLFCCHR